MKKSNDYYLAILITYILMIIATVCYCIWLKEYIEIPECIIHKWTGLYCPACGGTRAIIALSKGEIVHSFLYNPIVLYVFAFSTMYLIIETINIKLKKNIVIPWKLIIKIGILVFIINCVVQNVIGRL